MPPRRFQVDLTSVCVRRGAVQLPYRLQGTFSEGSLVAVDVGDGTSLELRFRPPRELLGLRAFFEAHALGANDAIALVFAAEGLQVEAVKRERSAASRGQKRHAVAGRDPEPVPSTLAAAGSRSSPQAGFPLLPVRLPPDVAHPPPPAVPATERPCAAERAVTASRPQWKPLDVMAPQVGGIQHQSEHPRRAPEGAIAAGGEALVREVRRAPAARPPPAAPSLDAGPGGAEAVAAERPGAVSSGGSPSGPSGPSERGERVGPLQGRGLALFGLRRIVGLGRGEAHRKSKEPVIERSATWNDGPADAAGRSPATVAGPSGEAGAKGVETAVADRLSAAEGVLSEQDLGSVLAYLARPQVPAIVRAQRVAEELGLPVEKVERALDRISEDSGRLSRIRAGAYMMRQQAES